MRKLIPFLNSPVAPPKQSTQKRFESVFASLTLLLQCWAAIFGQELAARMGSIYNRVTTMLYGEPSKLKAQFALWRSFYINYLRSSYDEAMLHTTSELPVKWEGYVQSLAELRDQYKSRLSPEMLQFYDSIVFAFLSFDRLMSFEVPANYDSITAPPREPRPDQEGELHNLGDHLASLGITPEEFKRVYREKARAQAHIIFSTSGPNGPASWTAHTDAKAIMGDSGLYTALQSFAEESGMTRFIQDLLGTVSLPSYDNRGDHMIRTARLHSFEEWGGKTRTVAILDYWTQLILTPLHDTIFHFLERIEMDGTFNQDAVAERVRRFTAIPDNSIFSYDLTAATDRLPISLQERVLTVLLGPSLAKNWVRILTNRDYFTADGKPLRYGAGQPMGAKSSWAMFTLTHHVIVQAAANMAGAAPYTDYGMVGDDVSMCGSSVSSNYRMIMDYYGVSINMAKSIVPFAGARPAAELCKRVFIDGVEISTLPVKLIAKTVANGRLAPQLQNHVSSRLSGGPDKALLTWIGGLIDIESFEFLTILNMLPRDVSGILHPQLDSFTEANLKVWFPDTKVSLDQIKEAYTYVAVVEQLKRLDNLLRQTQIITAAIETNAFGYHVQQIGNLGWMYDDPNFPVAKIAASMPKFNATHPIVRASVSEVDRIGDLLAGLRTGNRDLTAQARRRLLDMFRNALTDAWSDAQAARGQGERSLVQRALTTLVDICNYRLPVRDDKGNIVRQGHSLSFTVMLSYLNRLWHVDWRLGSPVQINAVKSKVLANPVESNTRLNSIISNLSIASRFAPQRRSSSVERPAASTVTRSVNPHLAPLTSTS